MRIRFRGMRTSGNIVTEARVGVQPGVRSLRRLPTDCKSLAPPPQPANAAVWGPRSLEMTIQGFVRDDNSLKSSGTFFRTLVPLAVSEVRAYAESELKGSGFVCR